MHMLTFPITGKESIPPFTAAALDTGKSLHRLNLGLSHSSFLHREILQKQPSVAGIGLKRVASLHRDILIRQSQGRIGY